MSGGSATEQQSRRYTFIVNVTDLALYWGGDAFASASIVLPLFVSRLTSSPIAVGLVPTLFSIAFVLPQLLTAGRVRRSRLKKPYALKMYVVQRSSQFLLAGAAVALGADNPASLLAAFFVIYAIGSVGLGAGVVAHQDVIAKVVPVDLRGRLRGSGIFLASLVGAAGGFVAREILDAQAFPIGFAICFAIAGVLQTISIAFVAANREPSAEVISEGPSLRDYLRQLPAILSSDHGFRRFLYSRSIFALATMALPFMPVYAISRFSLPDSALGTLTTAFMLGQMAAVLVFGFLGDRFGHRVVLLMGAASLATAFGLAVSAEAPSLMLVAFAFSGVSNAALQVSTFYIVLEFAPPADRPTYIALSSTIVAPATIIAPALGGWLASVAGYPVLFVVALVPALIGLISLGLWVPEPRAREVQVALHEG